MDMKSLKRQEAQNIMYDWMNNSNDLPKVDDYYNDIRENLQKYYSEVVEEYKNDSYFIDIHFGIKLYTLLEIQDGFNIRIAADDGFWRYLSLKVIPDVVTKRWGKNNEDHFWKRGTKIWLKSLWWYIYLSWQGDMNKTLSVLESQNCSTDIILNLLDRPGKGYYVNTYREIMYFYSRVPKDELARFNKKTKTKSDTLFRVIMRLNTARTKVIHPSLYNGGEKEYVKSLFNSVGIDV